MVRETICLFDTDLLYGKMVLQALQEEAFLPGTYAHFSDMDALSEYLEHHKVTLLLLEKIYEEAFYEQLMKKELSEHELSEWQQRILLLSEEKEDSEREIYKYMPRKEMGARIRNWWAARVGENSPRKEAHFLGNGHKQVITGYITFGGESLARYMTGLGQNMAGGLVLNLELFAYTNPHEKPQKSLSDLIYLATTDQMSKAAIKDYIYTAEAVDYVEPVVHYSDGYELDGEVIGRIFKFLRTLPYENILIITDCRHRGTVDLLEQCDEVKAEEAGNFIEQFKNNLLRQMLHLEGRDELLVKLKMERRERQV